MPDQSSAAFISYCRDDQEFALRLAQDLKAAGAAIWLDQLDIKAGSSWDNAVENALLAAPQMLVVLSPTSVKSENVRDEISYALRQGKTVIPVLYMECVIPLRLERKQHIDFRVDYSRGLERLLRELHVERPNQAVIDKAAEGDVQRELAWKAREAEAERRRNLAEQQKRVQTSRQTNETKIQQQEKEDLRGRELKQQAASPRPQPITPKHQQEGLLRDVKAQLWFQRRSSWVGLAAIFIVGFVFFLQSLSSHPDTASKANPIEAQPIPQQAIPQSNVVASQSPSRTAVQPSAAPVSEPTAKAIPARGPNPLAETYFSWEQDPECSGGLACGYGSKCLAGPACNHYVMKHPLRKVDPYCTELESAECKYAKEMNAFKGVAW